MIDRQKNNSVFDQEYDYLVSIGHRCCVASGNNYQRKSSFPLDWQITHIDILPNLFRDEFKDYYPNSGVHFVHRYHDYDEHGNDLGVSESLTKETFDRRCSRLVNLIKNNNRKILFVRSKYQWYWSKKNHHLNIDQNPTHYDLFKLKELSSILLNQYKNNNFKILYIYTDLSDEDITWDENDEIDQALTLFKGCLEEDPKDHVSKIYVDRCERGEKRKRDKWYVDPIALILERRSDSRDGYSS